MASDTIFFFFVFPSPSTSTKTSTTPTIFLSPYYDLPNFLQFSNKPPTIAIILSASIISQQSSNLHSQMPISKSAFTFYSKSQDYQWDDPSVLPSPSFTSPTMNTILILLSLKNPPPLSFSSFATWMISLPLSQPPSSIHTLSPSLTITSLTICTNTTNLSSYYPSNKLSITNFSIITSLFTPQKHPSRPPTTIKTPTSI